MKSLAVVVAAAVVLPALPARAAPGTTDAQRRVELERDTGMDLSDEWTAFQSKPKADTFPNHVNRRLRTRRDVGRGLVVAGTALILTSTFFLFLGLTENSKHRQNIHYGVMGSMIGVGGLMVIPGATLWSMYAKRIDKLEKATGELELELASRRHAQPAQGGLGLRFAF